MCLFRNKSTTVLKKKFITVETDINLKNKN